MNYSLGTRLFGETYSGLEFDYRGLCHIYLQSQNYAKVVEYQTKLHQWNLLRDTVEIRKISNSSVKCKFFLFFGSLKSENLRQIFFRQSPIENQKFFFENLKNSKEIC